MRVYPAVGLASALVLFSCATPGPPPDAVRAEADAEFLRENYARAEMLYVEAIPRVASEYQGALWLQAGKCRMARREYALALEAFDNALKSASAEPLALEIYYRRAIAHNILWKPELAINDLRRVQEASREVRDRAVKSEEFLLRLGVTLLRTGSWIQGRQVLEELVREFPQSDEAAQAKDLIPMRQYSIRIGRGDESSAQRKAKEALSKGLAAEVVPCGSSPSDRLVLVGRFARFEDAVRELSRVRDAGYRDAYPFP